MKKILTILLALLLAVCLTACSSGKTEEGGEEATEITLWTYPIGGWGNQETVDGLIADFEAANPGVTVTVEYLDYTNGDDQVNTAIQGKETPDLIMEGPERLVANWGEKGYMVDISDLLDSDDKTEINASALAACTHTSGAVYEYPVVMTAHCMAVNLTRLTAACEAAGITVADVLDVESHTWTTEGFFKAVEVLNAYHPEATVASLFCSGQGGDQGTRAIINNLYGGTWTNAEHTAYTLNDENNIKALEILSTTAGITFDASIAGGDEINLFRQGLLDMAFCWNIAQQLNSDNAPAEKTNDGEDILFMAFPATVANESKLCGGIWGFGIFDNGDEARANAAKAFIKYFGDNAEGTTKAVSAANYFAVRSTVDGADISNIWSGNEIMSEYNKLMPLLGDYYQVTTNWAVARTAAWNMLQQIGTGTPVKDAVATFQDAVK